jgi:hypothetical protein
MSQSDHIKRLFHFNWHKSDKTHTALINWSKTVCTVFEIQLVPLNGITDKRISWIIGSKLCRFKSPKLSFHT